jgi:hypothetical protein
MRIQYIEIQNFKRLKQARIDFGSDMTVFVGANNSGKTTAMDACIKFLARTRTMCFNDFTASNRAHIDNLGSRWLGDDCPEPENLSDLEPYLPTFDVWIEVKNSELQYVFHIIPTLDWRQGVLGVLYLYQPIDIKDLFIGFRRAYTQARMIENQNDRLKLWPTSLCEYIDKTLTKQFAIKAYILDPASSVQKTSEEMASFEANPLDKLMFVRVIEAQRHFSDVDNTSINKGGLLSSQLKDYYKPTLTQIRFHSGRYGNHQRMQGVNKA